MADNNPGVSEKLGNERDQLYAASDTIRVYQAPDTAAALAQFNPRSTGDLRNYKKDDFVGFFTDLITSSSGQQFIQIESWRPVKNTATGNWEIAPNVVYVKYVDGGPSSQEVYVKNDPRGTSDANFLTYLKKNYTLIWDSHFIAFPSKAWVQFEGGSYVYYVQWPGTAAVNFDEFINLPYTRQKEVTITQAPVNSPTQAGKGGTTTGSTNAGKGTNAPTQPQTPSPGWLEENWPYLAAGLAMVVVFVVAVARRKRHPSSGAET